MYLLKYKWLLTKMDPDKGYIYVRRSHNSYDIDDVCKLGKTQNIPERDTQYATGELKRGYFEDVYEVPKEKVGILEKLLQSEFRELNVKYDAGVEFYDKKIIKLIEPYLNTLRLIYRRLSKEEISLLVRCNRVKATFNKVKKLFNELKIKNIIQTHKTKRIKKNSIGDIDNIENDTLFMIKPNDHQQYILEIIGGFFNLYNIGKIVWACGLGKALLSILIVKLLEFNSVLIGVPSNNLQKQIKNEIIKLFPNKNNILFVGGDETDGIKSTTNKTQIIKFLNNKLNSQPKFAISTYHSCHLLVDTEIAFEIKIGDECHHLVGIEKDENRGFRLFHKINSLKTLFMTATEKTIEIHTNKETYSMENETIFGKYIDVKSVRWAIENKKITDYNILVLKNTQDEVDEIISSLKLHIINKEIFISCYMCLKSFEKYNNLTHLLLYTNTTEDAEVSKKYINEILSLNVLSIQKEKIYNNSLHSKNCNDLDSEVNKFKNTYYGIISCVYIFGEGFDLPKLNGVCIAGNMQSETRIVQYLLRPNRLDFENPNKKAYVIIPYIDADDWETQDKSYDKVRTIVSQMRNVDENIEQKIFVSVWKKEKSRDKKRRKEKLL